VITLLVVLSCVGAIYQSSEPGVMRGAVPAGPNDWRDIQSDVAKFSGVCSYDRAGYGWSDAGPKPRTSEQIAREIRALLDAAKENFVTEFLEKDLAGDFERATCILELSASSSNYRPNGESG
jgi:hypothetical protein